MTATEVKRRRGTESQCDLLTPAEGEIIVDLTNNRLRVGDAVQMGGYEIPNAIDLQRGSFNTANATGTNALTLTLDPVPTYTTGMEINFKAANNNTSTVTINVNGLGTKDLKKISGGAVVVLVASDIVAGAYYTARYDGSQFILVGAGGGVNQVTGSAGVVVSPTTGAPVVMLDTNNSLGIGAYALLYWRNSGTLANGATVGSSDLYIAKGFSTGFTLDLALTVTGTWRNVSGYAMTGGGGGTFPFGLFIRTA